jgi:hypothetical protein
MPEEVHTAIESHPAALPIAMAIAVADDVKTALLSSYIFIFISTLLFTHE